MDNSGLYLFEDDAAIPLTDASGETTWITPCGWGARGQWNSYYRGNLCASD